MLVMYNNCIHFSGLFLVEEYKCGECGEWTLITKINKVKKGLY